MFVVNKEYVSMSQKEASMFRLPSPVSGKIENISVPGQPYSTGL